MAEWLRRLTRNQIPSGSVGSNPTDCDTEKSILLLELLIYFPHLLLAVMSPLLPIWDDPLSQIPYLFLFPAIFSLGDKASQPAEWILEQCSSSSTTTP